MTTLSLRSIRLRSGEEYRDERDVALEPLELGGQRYVPVPERVSAALTVLQATTGKVLELRFRGRLHGPCQRCLADAVIERDVDVREYQANDPDASEELRSPYVRAEQLDLTAWARDSLVLALPDQILCRADCAGLCAVCGRDLNLEPHEHAEEALDPRWSALEQLRERL